MRMATPHRQNPLGFQRARTPMNGEPRTNLIQLISRTESLSGDDDLAPAPDVDSSPQGDKWERSCRSSSSESSGDRRCCSYFKVLRIFRVFPLVGSSARARWYV